MTAASIKAVPFPSVGLVIQGPILSVGRTPLAAFLPHEDVIASDIVRYNSSENVRHLLDQAKQLFGKVVCITWDTEDVTKLSDLVEERSVVQIPDSTPLVQGRTQLLPTNNKFKQFLSTRHGLDILAQHSNISYAIKIRTDQSLNLEALGRCLVDHAAQREDNKWLLVPAFMPGMPAGVHDFYFGAPLTTCSEICDSFLSRIPLDFCSNVHTDFFARLACRWGSQDKGAAPFLFLRDGDFYPISHSQKEMVAALWSRHLKTFPRRVWETMLWRGCQMHRSYYPSNMYSDDRPDAISPFIRQVADSDRDNKVYLAKRLDNYLSVNWLKFFAWRGVPIPRCFAKIAAKWRGSLPVSGNEILQRLRSFQRSLVPPALLSVIQRFGSKPCSPVTSPTWQYNFAAPDTGALVGTIQAYFVNEWLKFETKTSNPLIIDCGANVGISIRYWKHIMPNCRIIAFESDPGIFEMLKRNTHDLSDVTLLEGAAWTADGDVRFIPVGHEGGHLKNVGTQRNDISPVVVRGYRLRSFLDQPVELLKVDIEGAELDVFADCADLLHNVARVFVEYHSFVEMPQRLSEFVQVLERAGFRMHIAPGLNSPQPFVARTIYNYKDMYLNIFAYRP